jgi:hypothetical protein
MADPNYTEQSIRQLVAHARSQHPQWEWKLLMRPETAALVDLDAGLVWHPDPKFEPLDVMKFDDCEISIIELVGDFVMASPVDEHGFTPEEQVPSYWLNLRTAAVAQWTAASLDEVRGLDRDVP